MRVVAALLLVVHVSAAGAQGTAVVYSDGRPPVLIDAVVRQGMVYHRLDQVASSLNGLFTWVSARRRAAMITGSDSVAVTIDSRFIAVNGRALCVDTPVRYAEGTVLVPESFMHLVPPLLHEVNATWVDSLGELWVEGAPCDVQLMRITEDSLTATIELAIPSHAVWRLSSARGDSVILSIQGATVCSSDFDSLFTTFPGVTCTARQEPGKALLRMDLAVPGLEVRCAQEGALLTVVMEAAIPRPFAPLLVQRIVLDAGHGGADTGAESPDGALEKSVTLTLAKLMTGYLRTRRDDLEVILTRDADTDVPPSIRSQQANAAGAGLFLSLHCNWSFDRNARGFRVFFSEPGRSTGSRGVVALGNAVIPTDDPRSAPARRGRLTTWDLAHDPWLRSSGRVARILTEAVLSIGVIASPPAQVRTEPVVGIAMPAVVLEVGYLSNPIEARDLVTLEYLDAMAEALAAGIDQFVALPAQPEEWP